MKKITQPKIHFGHLRAVAKLILLVIVFALGVIAFLISERIKDENKRAEIVRRCTAMARRVVGIRVKVIGRPVEDNPAIYIANHLSYLDIPVLGSVLSASFISRADVGSWPVIGWFAKHQRTIFTSRKKGSALNEAKIIRERLEAGDRLLMFPEGTSGEGLRTLPFKSTFLSVAAPIVKNGVETQITVQPVTLVHTEMGGLPVSRYQRAYYAWFGDMEFAPHFWQALQMPGFTLEVRFHAPTTMAEMGDRKALCRYCEEAISRGLAEGLNGRTLPLTTETATSTDTEIVPA